MIIIWLKDSKENLEVSQLIVKAAIFLGHAIIVAVDLATILGKHNENWLVFVFLRQIGALFPYFTVFHHKIH